MCNVISYHMFDGKIGKSICNTTNNQVILIKMIFIAINFDVEGFSNVNHNI